jgi:hypothetical protein
VGKTTFVDQNPLSGRSSKLRMFQGEGVISKCLNGRLTDATNKLRASTVDVIRESRRRGPVKEQLDGVQFWKQSKGRCAKRRKQTTQISKGLAAPRRALGQQAKFV